MFLGIELFCDGGVDFSSDDREVVLKAFIESCAGFPTIYYIFAEVTFDTLYIRFVILQFIFLKW